MSRPEVSVVVPTRNRWHFLSRLSLPSALAQEDVVHEVIVVDDGSTDETPQRLAEVGNPKLVVLTHPRPLGASAARNTGIDAARGAWVSFLDDDDVWSPRKLRVQLDCARSAGASFVYGDIAVLDESGTMEYELQAPRPEELGARLRTPASIPGGCSNVMVKTALLRKCGGFDTSLSGSEDWDLWLRLAARASAASCPDVLVACTVHRNTTYVRNSWREIRRSLRHFRGNQRSPELDFDVARFWRWVAMERRRAGKRVDAAALLLLVSLRYGRPRYALQAIRSLVPGGAAAGVDRRPAEEPEWLRSHRELVGWPSPAGARRTAAAG